MSKLQLKGRVLAVRADSRSVALKLHIPFRYVLYSIQHCSPTSSAGLTGNLIPPFRKKKH